MSETTSSDFSMYAGDDKILQVTVRDLVGTTVDITDFTEIRWALSKSVGRQPPILEKVLSAGVEIISGGVGRFDVTINSADTESLRHGDYYHEAEVINEDGLVATVLAGTVTILPTLIKPEESP